MEAAWMTHVSIQSNNLYPKLIKTASAWIHVSIQWNNPSEADQNGSRSDTCDHPMEQFIEGESKR